jgi:hypothetical protein
MQVAGSIPASPTRLGLGRLCEEGVAVTIRGEPAAIGGLRVPGRLPSQYLILQEASS